MKKLTPGAKRTAEMFVLRLRLAALNAAIVSDDNGGVCVRCPEQNREAVAIVMNDHGIVTS